MNRNQLSSFVFLAVSLMPISAAVAEDTRGQEPEQNATLTIDGKSHTIIAGKPARVRIDGKQKVLELEISPYREFDKAGIKFSYLGQRHFSYDKLSAQVDHWSLDGNNTIIMVQHYHVPVTRKDILNEFQKQFQSMNASIRMSSAKLKHKHGSLAGDRLDITLGNVRLSQDIFVIADKKSTRTFILQDSITDKGKNTDEYLQARKRIEKTLSL